MKFYFLPAMLLLSLVLTSCDGYSFQDGNVCYVTNEAAGKTVTVLKGANSGYFKELKDGYACDDDQVWYHEHELKGVSAKKFHILGEGYATDGKNVYKGPKIYPVDDVASFRP